MNAAGITERILSLPDGGKLPPSAPFTAISRLAGVEIAVTASTAENAIRKAWRDRRGGGSTPLLVLADNPGRAGALLAVGVADAYGPLRSIEATSLADVFTRISTKPRLEAVREISSELELLDQAGVPGLKVRGLLTLHTLDIRLRQDQARWGATMQAAANIQRGTDWRSILVAFGYELEQLKIRGYLARYEGRPVAVVQPKADPSDFGKLDADSRSPEGLLMIDCLREGAGFGILANGGRLRLFRTSPGGSASSCIDLDAGALQPGDLPFLALLSPAFLAKGGFERLEDEARAFGGELKISGGRTPAGRSGR